MRTAVTIYAAILIMVAVSTSVYAVPAVTGVTGTVSHSSSVSISGSGFGTKSPAAPVMWDPIDGQSAYSGLSNGDTVPVGGSNPWPRASTDGPVYYKTTNPRGKWTAKYSNQWAGTGPGVVGGKDFSTQCAGGKLYLIWWYYSTGTSDDLAGDGESNKFNRLTNNGNGDNTPSQLNLMPDHSIGYDINIGYVFNTWYGWTGTRSAWNRVDEVIDNSTTPHPNVKIYVNNSLLANSTASQSLPVDICGISSLGFDVSNDPTATVMDFGEIYVDNTLARVEICAGSTWASRGHCEIQIPSAWSTSSANVTVNQGSFADGSTQYLYVVDSAGSANSSGYSVTFGEGTTDETPPTVASAAVNGSTVTVNFSENVVTTGYDSGDFNLDCTTAGNDIALSSPSGSGSSRTFTSALPIGYGDTCNLDYIGSTDDIEDTAGNDLEVFSNTSVTNNTPQPLTESIIDNGTSGKTSSTGTWTGSTYYSGYYGAGYLYSNSSVSDTYTWTETNLSPGTFNVYAWWVAGAGGRPTAAQYDITYSGGTATVYKDQNSNGGSWQLLGTYTFGSTGSVLLHGCTGCGDGTVTDAIRFLQAGEDTTNPTVTAFDLPAAASSLAVPINTFTVADEAALHAQPYCVTTTNSSAGCSWQATAPAIVTFGSTGSQTAYAWARDAAGNISSPAVTDTVTITTHVMSLGSNGTCRGCSMSH